MEKTSMTINQIKQFFNERKVGHNGVLPLCKFACLVKNPNYDPEDFSQEIENSEVEINWFKEMKKKMNEPDFDFIWNNTLSSIPKNSQRWIDNHSKKCEATIVFTGFCQSIARQDGTHDYCHEPVINEFQKILDEYGEIYQIN